MIFGGCWRRPAPRGVAESPSARSPAESRVLQDVGVEGVVTKPSVPAALRIQTTGKRLPVIGARLFGSVFASS